MPGPRSRPLRCCNPSPRAGRAIAYGIRVSRARCGILHAAPQTRDRHKEGTLFLAVPDQQCSLEDAALRPGHTTPGILCSSADLPLLSPAGDPCLILRDA